MSSAVRSLVRRIGVATAALVLVSACADQPTQPDPDISFAKGGGGGGPKVDAADPPSAPQDITLDVRVIGSGFDNGSVVKFLQGGQSTPKIVTNSSTFIDKNNIIANITIAVDAEVTLYDIEVTSSRGKKGIGSELFSVTSAQSQPVVQAVDPTIASRGNTLDVRVLGSGFDNGSQVTWLLGGVPAVGVTTNSTVYVDKSEVVANITIAPDAEEGLHDVEVVTGSGKRAVGVEMFNVSDGFVEHWSVFHDITYYERGTETDIVLLSSDGSVPPVRIDLAENDFWLYLGSPWGPDVNTLIFCGDEGVYGLRRVAPAVARGELLFTPSCVNIPHWSPDGLMIAYERIPDTPPVEGVQHFELFVRPVDLSGAPTGPEVQISNDPDVQKNSITWSPDSRRVAMLSSDLGVIVYEFPNFPDVTDVSRQTVITTAELGGGASAVSWANHSDRLAITKSNPTDILIVDFESGVTVTCNLTADLDVPARNPVWSPDDSKLLFQRKLNFPGAGGFEHDLVTVELSPDRPGCPAAYSEEVLVPVTGNKRNRAWGMYPQWRR